MSFPANQDVLSRSVGEAKDNKQIAKSTVQFPIHSKRKRVIDEHEGGSPSSGFYPG
jgi:hypothetical protein